MKKFFGTILLCILLSCCTHYLVKAVTPVEHDPLADIKDDELNQEPLMGQLPCGAGVMFAYTFSSDVTQEQAFYIMFQHMKMAWDNGIDLEGKVYIILFSGPKKMTMLTADFKMNEVEFREEYVAKPHNKDKYRQRTWKGDALYLIEYLTNGYTGHSVVQKGLVSLEKMPAPNPDDPCPKLQGVHE